MQNIHVLGDMAGKDILGTSGNISSAAIRLMIQSILACAEQLERIADHMEEGKKQSAPTVTVQRGVGRD